jgi:hypothetical protein
VNRETAVGRSLWKWIVRQNGVHLGGGTYDDADRFAGVGLQPRFKGFLDGRFGFAAREHDIAAGDVGTNAGKP